MKKQFREGAEEFVIWLSTYLNAPEIDDTKALQTFHQWRASSNRAAKNKGDVWSCTSLFDAYQKYYWKSVDPTKEGSPAISVFEESEQCLHALGKELNDAINARDAEATLNACEKILRWGGVAQWKVAGKIRSLSGNLPAYLNDVRTFLKDCDGSKPSNSLITKYGLEVDSGTTKIYSLLDENWAIYDGRVGAALGLLVGRWASDNNVKNIPDVLRFAWGYESRRNPNKVGERTFPIFSTSVDRFEQNLYLNWLLEFLLEHKSEFNKLAHPLRALEAALFMIGYCVRDQNGSTEDREADAEQSELSSSNFQSGIFREAILRQFGGNTEASIPMQRNGSFQATLTEQGIVVSNLGVSRVLEWRVFDEVEQLLKEVGGEALRGNAVEGKLGDQKLPLNSVEGRIAQAIYGKQHGESVFRRITPVANILVWSGVCKHGRSSLRMIK